MRYLVLACDYDNTLALEGRVGDATVKALERCIDSGRKLLLVTGRRLDDLRGVFPQAELFETIVAENGAVLYRPSTGEETVLAEPPPPEFIAALGAAGVEPHDVGRVIVATWQPHELTVLEIIRRLGLEQQIIFNRGAVMVLPSGVNKATGLGAALRRLGISPHNVVGIGDGENDHALIEACQVGVAVANAVPMLLEKADLVTRGEFGDGVVEIVDRLVAGDLAELDPRLARHNLLLGWTEDGGEVRMPPFGLNLLIGGTPGAGKSTFATALVERLEQQNYQFCIVDPEGDYEDLEGTVSVGSAQQPPELDTAMKLLEQITQNVVFNLLAVPWRDRPALFMQLLTRLQQMRTEVGRPHWLIVDEAHHVLPAEWETGDIALPDRLSETGFITLEPDLLNPVALAKVGLVIAIGTAPEETLRIFTDAVGAKPPSDGLEPLEPGQFVFWQPGGPPPAVAKLAAPKLQRRRHERKYAEGQLEPERSFYFRGPDGELNLRAQNLSVFLQMAEGVDEETWLYHLRKHDFSDWFRQGIKDPRLADEAAAVEADEDLSAEESRRQIDELVNKHYSLPAMVRAARPAAHRAAE